MYININSLIFKGNIPLMGHIKTFAKCSESILLIGQSYYKAPLSMFLHFTTIFFSHRKQYVFLTFLLEMGKKKSMSNYSFPLC